MGLLSQISSPADLKALTPEQLPAVAEELRQALLDSVAETGGHLASNLGVIELTIALHYLLDLPQDKLLWDVGHQGYPHKMLTGRRERFATLRQWGGLSGFLRPDESPYDCWGAGHAGTAISGALGMALARDLGGHDHRVVAVTGDGALTCGLAWEALNHAGGLGTPLLVVLNDNEMSIAENVGAMSRYFNRLITTPVYNRIKTDIRELLDWVPSIARPTCEAIRRLEEGVKNLIVPDIVFEEFGFRYFGPIDGHDLDCLLGTLSRILLLTDRPCILHVITEKGHGYPLAQENPIRFHGVSPFDVSTGQQHSAGSSLPSYTRIFSDTLVEIAAEDERVVAITAAMANGVGLDRFQQRFPDRFFDVGIAEGHAVTMAAGMAAGGLRPVVGIYSTFLQRAFDQILHDVCIHRYPVTLAIDRAGIVGADGETHQGVFDIGFLRMIPNMVVACPCDENELRHMLLTAINSGQPFAVRYPRDTVSGMPLDQVLRPIPIGSWQCLQEGADLALLATGTMVATALQVARQLASESGLHCTVINARFVAPLDEAMLLETVGRVPRIVTLEEHLLAGGFSSAVGEALAAHHQVIPQLPIGLPRRFIEHGSREQLLSACGLDAVGCLQAIRQWLGLLEQNDVAKVTRLQSRR